VSPQAAAAARAGAVPARAPLPQPALPRRVSGPAPRPRPVERRTPFVRLLDSPFLDRLLRGRIWIALVGCALLGIVAMQVTILRLGASIGASVTKIQQLEQANQSMETGIARLEPGGNIAGTASRLGMVYPPAGNVAYLHVGPGQAATAADSITKPTAPLVPIGSAAQLTAPLGGADTTTSASQSSADTTQSATQQQAGAGTTVGQPTDAATTTGQPPDAATTTGQPTGAGTIAGGSANATPPAGTPTTASLGAGGGSAAPGASGTGG
jgi:hypothetical protein